MDAGKTESYSFSATSSKYLTYEKELFELVQLSDVPLDNDLFKVIFELLKENVAPNAIVQVLKALRTAIDGHSPTSSSKASTKYGDKTPSVSTLSLDSTA